MSRYKALDPVKDQESGVVTMRVPKLRLRMLLSTTIDKLKADGVDPTVDEIIWLHELCKEDIFPGCDEPPAYLVPPVVLGAGSPRELWLWEPTISALTWLEECAEHWWKPGEDLAPAIFSYHYSAPELRTDFRLFCNRRDTVRTVNRWWRALTFTRAELVWAYEQLSRIHRDGYETIAMNPACMSRHDSDSPMEWGEVIAGLSAIYQMPPEHFVHMNQSQVVSLWNSSDRTPIAAMLGGGGGVRKSSGGKSMMALGAAVRHIIERHKQA